jgi:hypothetical protein
MYIQKTVLRPFFVLDRNGKKIGRFDNQNRAAEYFNIPLRASVNNCLRKKSKTCSGLRFVYCDEYVLTH